MFRVYLDKANPSLPLRHTKRYEQLHALEQIPMAAAIRAVIHDGHHGCCRPLVGQDGTLTLGSGGRTGELLLHVGYGSGWFAQIKGGKSQDGVEMLVDRCSGRMLFGETEV